MTVDSPDAGTHSSSLRQVALVSGCSFLGLALQFIFQIVLARLFGASSEMDAYVAAMTPATVLSAILIGSLGYALVPAFSERRARSGEAAAQAMATTVIVVVMTVALVLSAGVALAAGPITAHLFPGFSAAQAMTTVSLMRILAWLLVINALANTIQALYHCHQRFAWVAITPLLGTVTTLALLLLWRESIDIHWVAWAVIGGALATALVQLPPATRFLRLSLGSGAMRCFTLLAPLVIGALYVRLDPVVDRYLASHLAAGSLAHLAYAQRIFTALLTLSVSGLSVVAFPAFANHSAAGKTDDFRAEISHAFRFLVFVVTPIVVGLIGFAGSIVRDLFQGGAFTADDTEMVAWLLVVYGGAIVASSVGELAGKIMYALGAMRIVTAIAIVGFTLGVALKLLLTPLYGVAAIAGSTSVYFTLTSSWVLILIGRRVGWSSYAGVGSALLRALLASAVSVAVAAVIVRAPVPMPSLVAAPFGALTYLTVMALFRDELALRGLQLIRRR